MKKIILGLMLATSAAFTFADDLATSSNLPVGNYTGMITETNGSWHWQSTDLTGNVDSTGKVTINIPGNSYLWNLPGTLTADVAINGNTCTANNAQVMIGNMPAKVAFSNCIWMNGNLSTDFTTENIMGTVITGTANISQKI